MVVILKKLNNNKGFTMTELLITMLFIVMFTGMITSANRMLAHVAGTAMSTSQQSSLSSVVIDAITSEMRSATDISYFNTSYFNEYNSTTHTDHAGFVYNSKLFDYRQADSTINYREIIYVDSTNNKLYVGRAHSDYSISSSGTTPAEAPKALIGGAMYENVKVYLHDPTGSAKTRIVTPATTTDPVNGATFQIVLYLEDTTTGNTSLHTQDVTVTVAPTVTP